MTTSYELQPRRAQLCLCGAPRIQSARYAEAVTPSDSTELPYYGKLLVTNAGSGAETLSVIMASNNVDDTTAVTFEIAPVTTIVLPVLVRRVMATNTGADISVVLLG